MTAPTFVADYESATGWGSATSPHTGSVTTAVGDVLAVLSAMEANGNSMALPTGGTGTYVNRVNLDPANQCQVRVDVAVTGITAQTYTLSQTRGASSLKYGWDALRFSGSDGEGAFASTSAFDGAPSLSITTTQADSAICVICADFEAGDGTTRTWRTVNGITPTAANGLELVYFRDAAAYTVYVAYYSNAGAIGAKTVGLTLPSGQDYAIAALEIKGTVSAAARLHNLLHVGQ